MWELGKGGKATGTRLKSKKTRTGKESRVVVEWPPGEQRYLINTNASSKLFRQASNIPLSPAFGTQQTDEPIR